MLSCSTGHGAGYLLGSVAGGRENYYLDATTAGEPPGIWQGRGAAELGLDGEVDAKVMEAVYSEFRDPRDAHFLDPETASECNRLGGALRNFRTPDAAVDAYLRVHPDALPEQIGQVRAAAERSARANVMFMDLTFGVQKSVTVLHASFQRAELEAERTGDEAAHRLWAGRRIAVEEAVHAGNAAMLDYMQDRAGYVRGGGGRSRAAVHHLDAHDWTVASFFQHTNRGDEPHLHIHNAVLNRAPTEDGRWLAPDGKAMHSWKQGGGAVAERVMQEQLATSLGIQWRINTEGHTREVVGIDRSTLDLFSKRTAKITKKTQQLIDAAQERFGRTLSPLEINRLRQQATLATRPAKRHDGETIEQRLDRWHDALKRELAGGMHRVAHRFATRSAAQVEPPGFIRSRVLARALDKVQEGRATWSRAELWRQIDLALPDNLGGLTGQQVVALVDSLVETALASEEVVQTSGQDIVVNPPTQLLRADGQSVYRNPAADQFATRQHVIAEEALRRAAVDRGRLAVEPDRIDAWLAERPGMLGADQAAAVRGITTSGAGLSVLVGPAGAGKSHTAGALAASWKALTGGRVVGLAVTQVATEVLKDDGIGDAVNTAMWLKRQEEHDPAWALGPRDMVLVDEASMVDTRQLGRIRAAVDAAGARGVLIGDPAQLGSVGAGGIMALLARGEAETYSLADVRRFHDGWERAASLQLRAGDPGVVRQYDRHGRLVDGGTKAEAMGMAARSYVADRLDGRTSVIVAGTNDDAAELNSMIRERLVALGLVEPEGVVMGRDGNTAGIGDVVAARRIDWSLGLLNRRQYEVITTRPDGSLSVASLSGGDMHEVPAEYAQQHLTLGYAGTVHSTQGMNVDTGAQVVSLQTARSAAYVGMTRGRERNTAFVVTDEPRDPLAADIDVTDPTRRSAAAVFTDVITREDAPSSALADIQVQAEWARSAATLDVRVEDAVRAACRHRMDTHLDDLVAEGVLDEADRARLGADAGSVYLARVLRASEQAGLDPRDVLREAVADERGLAGVRSVAQVLSGRITKTCDLAPDPDHAGRAPAGLMPDMAAYLDTLLGLQAQREATLAEQAATEPPRWALVAFGPVPDDQQARQAWLAKVGPVAQLREASGWDHEEVPIGPGPGIFATERRATWTRAWDALGRPSAQAEEGDLSDGALLNRVAAWQREQSWAPDYVDKHMRASASAGHEGRIEAAFALAEGREEEADKHRHEAEEASSTARRLDEVAAERGKWVIQGAETREAAVRARQELADRGIDLDDTREWVSVRDYLIEVTQDPDGPVWSVGHTVTGDTSPKVAPAADIPTEQETEVMLARARAAAEVMADRQSQEAAVDSEASWHDVDAESRAWVDTEAPDEIELGADGAGGV